MEEKEKFSEALDDLLNDRLDKVVLSNPRQKEKITKAVIRPVLLKGKLYFQAEEFVGKQAFHKNLDREEAKDYLLMMVASQFKNCEAFSPLGTVHVLVGNRGTMTVKRRGPMPEKATAAIQAPPPTLGLTHNRKKRYILEEGTPAPFLIALGVMTQEGKVVRAKYDKFRQINRFLEFIEDILPKLSKDRENTIIDFGCGKSYLTFAMYYYLKELKGYPVRIVGLDLKADVICLCNRLAEEFGFENLRFYQGDIAGFEGVTQVDMVVTLHACDTATDYALAKAVAWGATVILSVPCCQHELNGQLESGLLEPVLHYGLLKERMAALFTDGLRAQLLEGEGYRAQILEFIDMEHTPKNILIRAVKQGEKKDNHEKLEKMMEELRIRPTLCRLLWK